MVWPSHELELTQFTLLTGATLRKRVNRGEEAWGLLVTDPGKGPDPPPLGDNSEAIPDSHITQAETTPQSPRP